MNMATRPMTEREMRDLMHSLGWELHFHSGDRSTWSFMKQHDGITLHCNIRKQGDGWAHSFKHIPGVQMLVTVTSNEASFPHPKFTRWERRMFDYAAACEAVAKTH